MLFNFDFNTPIYKLKLNMNNNNFYIKRDDLIPFSFGGNKVRIAYEFFKDMIEKRKNCIISYGSPSSNLNRVISNMASFLNIKSKIIYSLDNDFFNNSFNNILTQKIGFDIYKCQKQNVSQTVKKVIEDCIKEGLNPYYIYGNEFGKGNEKTPLKAYIKAYDEIMEYERNNKKEFNYIFHASGTGVTQSGLLLGNIRSRKNTKIIGISISRNEKIGKEIIYNNIKEYLGKNKYIDNDIIHFEDKYLYGGYSKYNYNIVKTINDIYKKEGIPLDTTYTGKAFNGMLEYIKEKNIKNKDILFIHTGGTPLFFDNVMEGC